MTVGSVLVTLQLPYVSLRLSKKVPTCAAAAGSCRPNHSGVQRHPPFILGGKTNFGDCWHYLSFAICRCALLPLHHLFVMFLGRPYEA